MAWTLRAARHLVCGPDKVGLVCCQPAAISELLQVVMRPAAISSKHTNICFPRPSHNGLKHIHVRPAAGENTYFGNTIVRDSTLVFINMEFDLNISDEHSETANTTKTSLHHGSVLNLVFIHTMLHCESHARYAKIALVGRSICLSVCVQ